MNILLLNAGSSSLKATLMRSADGTVVARSLADWAGSATRYQYAGPTGWWVTPYHFGIDQGPIILAIENYRTGLIWNIMRRCPFVVAGLRRAGFTGGWL